MSSEFPQNIRSPKETGQNEDKTLKAKLLKANCLEGLHTSCRHFDVSLVEPNIRYTAPNVFTKHEGMCKIWVWLATITGPLIYLIEEEKSNK